MAALLIAALWSGGATQAQEGSDAPAFTVETLNPGLPERPARLDLSTPRAAMEAFALATARGDHQTAAHILDLDSVVTTRQGAQGPELARQLAFVLDRKIPIDFASLPDRPDGMQTRGSNRNPMVGEPRKSLRLGTLDLKAWPVTIRLNRVSVAGADPVWVISRQSVEHIPALYARYGPTAFEAKLPDALKASTAFGVLAWELIAIPLIAGTALAAAWLVWTAMTALADRIPLEGTRAALCRGRLPAALLVVGILLQLAVSTIFEFSAATDATLSVVFWIIIISALVLGVSRLLDTIIDVTSNRYLANIDTAQNSAARRWYTNLSAAKRIGVMFVVVVGLAVAFSSLRLFSSFGLSLLVSAGVATAVFGLAAQTVLGNIFSSMQLALAKPIRIGDAVYYNDHWAYVEQINYTFVQLRTWDLKRYIVPVKHFVSNPFENWTMAEPRMIMPVLLKLDHRTDVEELREVFADLAADDPDWSQGEEPKVQVIDHDEDGMAVRFYCTADDPTAAWNLHCRMREKLLAHLREKAEPASLPRTRLAYVADARADNPERARDTQKTGGARRESEGGEADRKRGEGQEVGEGAAAAR
ncbi:MAG: hypothetical protein AcusKO_24420 [Acuticoccus sp.]